MTDKKTEALKLALEAAYLAGFNASGEGYNGEYPFQDPDAHPEQDEHWRKGRDYYVREALAEQPAQQRHISYVCPQCHWSLDKQQAQQQWVGLTDEEIQKSAHLSDNTAPWTLMGFARAVEAKLKEKNT